MYTDFGVMASQFDIYSQGSQINMLHLAREELKEELPDVLFVLPNQLHDLHLWVLLLC